MKLTGPLCKVNVRVSIYAAGCTKQRSHMVCTDGVNLLDQVGECHSLVYDELKEVVRRGLARKQLKLAVDPLRPSASDTNSNLIQV
jgi:hypothetical protein